MDKKPRRRVIKKDKKGNTWVSEKVYKPRYFRGKDNKDGKHNCVKSELLIVLDILNKAGFQPLPPIAIAKFCSDKCGIGYIRAVDTDLADHHLISRKLMTYNGQPCYGLKIGGKAAEKFINKDIPDDLKQEINERLLANPLIANLMKQNQKLKEAEAAIEALPEPEPVRQPEPEQQPEDCPYFIRDVDTIAYPGRDNYYIVDLNNPGFIPVESFTSPSISCYICRNSQTAKQIFNDIKAGLYSLKVNMYGDIEKVENNREDNNGL